MRLRWTERRAERRAACQYTARRMWILYQLAMVAALLAAAPVLLVRRGRHYLPTLRQRLGFYGRSGLPATPGALWIHAVSVGEVAVAATLASALPREQPLIITTVTSTGQSRAHATFGAGSATGEQRAAVAYLPFDIGFAVRRFLRRFQPGALVLVEGDYWPLVLRACRRRGLPVLVVNGRVGRRSFGRWSRLRALWQAFHRGVVRFGVQSAQDRDRLLALGAAPDAVTVTGNLKFETAPPSPNRALEAAVERLAAGRPIVVAGSTMQGEDAQVLDAFSQALGGERALLVLVPRHPERWDSAAQLAADRGLTVVRRSTLDLGQLPAGRPDALLLDSIGELAALYRLAAVAFIGGTLVPTGGHNPLEAAHFGVPVVVGPSMFNFREMAEAFDQAAAWRRIADAQELGRVFRELLEAPAAAADLGARGRALIDANRGALARTRELVEAVLGAQPA